jgi:hypothetical protein
MPVPSKTTALIECTLIEPDEHKKYPTPDIVARNVGVIRLGLAPSGSLPMRWEEWANSIARD